MAITSNDLRVRINAMPKEGRVKAFASLTVADSFAIKDITVKEGNNGIFVSMPQQKDRQGKWYDVAFPVSKGLRDEISHAVMDAYEFAMEHGLKAQQDACMAAVKPQQTSGMQMQ